MAIGGGAGSQALDAPFPGNAQGRNSLRAISLSRLDGHDRTDVDAVGPSSSLEAMEGGNRMGNPDNPSTHQCARRLRDATACPRVPSPPQPIGVSPSRPVSQKRGRRPVAVWRDLRRLNLVSADLCWTCRRRKSGMSRVPYLDMLCTASLFRIG